MPENGKSPQAPADPATAQAALELAQANARKAANDADKAAADAQKALLDNQKSARELSSPAPTSTRPEGKIELGDGVGLVADLLAHSLIDQGAAAIAQRLAGKLKEKPEDESRVLLVADRELAASDWPYCSIRSSIDAYKSAFSDAKDALDQASKKEAAKPGEPEKPVEKEGVSGVDALAIAPALAGASAVVGGVADLVGWLRADYSIKSRQVTVGETPLLAALADHLAGKASLVRVDGFQTLQGSQLIADFAESLTARNNLKALSTKVNAEVAEPATRARDERIAALKEVTTAIAESMKAKDAPANPADLTARETALRQDVVSAEDSAKTALAAVSTADALVTSFDNLVTAITASPSTGEGHPPLLAAALRELLHDKAKGYTHVLYAGIESAGGESITKRWLWTDPSVRYIGGAQLSFMLLKIADNSIAAAGTLPLLATTKFSLGKGSAEVVQEITLGKAASSSAAPTTTVTGGETKLAGGTTTLSGETGDGAAAPAEAEVESPAK